ncbi:MAG TPA: hemolysin III family protein [Stellaceae bacterium]|nr:hemolysin III family protein [Stellaceae bacterium]
MRKTSTTPRIRSVSEEAASAAIEGSAAAASVAGLADLVLRLSPRADVPRLAAVVVYGVSMIVAFLASALYHGTQHPGRKRFFREIDHCTIFIYIAGTYTAVTVLALSHHGGSYLLAAVWALAIIGIALRLNNGAGFLRFAIPLYLAMGWLFLGWSETLYRAVGWTPMMLMLAGGVSYSGGLLFHRWDRLPYGNALWHVCVVAGSACFFCAITLFPQL